MSEVDDPRGWIKRYILSQCEEMVSVIEQSLECGSYAVDIFEECAADVLSKHWPRTLSANKSLEYYLNLPYTIELVDEKSFDDGGWFVRIKELPGCMSQADNPNEAIEMIRDVMKGWIENAIEDGFSIPEPTNNMEV